MPRRANQLHSKHTRKSGRQSRPSVKRMQSGPMPMSRTQHSRAKSPNATNNQPTRSTQQNPVQQTMPTQQAQPQQRVNGSPPTGDTSQDRLDRLEAMVTSLADTVSTFSQNVNVQQATVSQAQSTSGFNATSTASSSQQLSSAEPDFNLLPDDQDITSSQAFSPGLSSNLVGQVNGNVQQHICKN